MESGTEKQLRGVWGTSGSDVFAVGDSSVLHYDGNYWSLTIDDILMASSYYDVWGGSASDVYAWGRLRLHYNGVKWSADGLISNYVCFGLWGNSGTNIFAAGRKFDQNDYSGAIYHYIIDTDNDRIADEVDNCLETPNGPALGTCYSWSGMEEGTTCRGDIDCINLP
jgi:hypothetical protein